VPVTVVDAMQLAPLSRTWLMVTVPTRPAPSVSTSWPPGPVDADHCPCTRVSLCEKVADIVSVTVAPAVLNVHVPVQDPLMSMTVTEGAAGEPPQDRAAAVAATQTSQADTRRRDVIG